MSLRNIRKVYGGMQLPPPDEGSDEEYEPPCTQRHSRDSFSGLEISSDSEENLEDGNESAEEPVEPIKNKKNKKQKRKRNDIEELDEIDKCVKEVNALLGEPPMPPVAKETDDNDCKMKRLVFTVKQLNMDPIAELDRRFGPDDSEPKKPGRRPNLRKIAQKGFIIKSNKVYKRNGLFMTMLERKDDIAYFTFRHNKTYQNLHHVFLYSHTGPPRNRLMGFPLEESQQRMHVEGLLEIADGFYLMEEYSTGNKIVEDIINYMQHCAHPYFSVTDVRTRLLYSRVENRAFHIALLKYMHMLTNKACHRTSLEMAKILLCLDPSDPLAVLFMVDTIAMRAEEHQWFINAYHIWKKEKDAEFMFNMQYSYALANFHVARKMKGGFEKADELIQNAILRFPIVLTYIFKHSGNRSEKVKDCSLFGEEFNGSPSSNLNQLIFLFTKFIWHKFTEQPTLKWLKRNAEEVVDRYATDTQAQMVAEQYKQYRMCLFQTYPPEIIRHLSAIKSLSKLIVDGAVPDVGKLNSYDPLPPPDGISIYDDKITTPDDEENVDFIEIFTSMLPDVESDDPNPERRYDLPLPLESELEREPFLEEEVILNEEIESATESDDDDSLGNAPRPFAYHNEFNPVPAPDSDPVPDPPPVAAPRPALVPLSVPLLMSLPMPEAASIFTESIVEYEVPGTSDSEPNAPNLKLLNDVFNSVVTENFIAYVKHQLLVYRVINLEYIINIIEFNYHAALKLTALRTVDWKGDGTDPCPIIASLNTVNLAQFCDDVSMTAKAREPENNRQENQMAVAHSSKTGPPQAQDAQVASAQPTEIYRILYGKFEHGKFSGSRLYLNDKGEPTTSYDASNEEDTNAELDSDDCEEEEKDRDDKEDKKKDSDDDMGEEKVCDDDKDEEKVCDDDMDEEMVCDDDKDEEKVCDDDMDEEKICNEDKDEEKVCGDDKDEKVCDDDKDEEKVCDDDKDEEKVCDDDKDEEKVCDDDKDEEKVCDDADHLHDGDDYLDYDDDYLDYDNDYLDSNGAGGNDKVTYDFDVCD